MEITGVQVPFQDQTRALDPPSPAGGGLSILLVWITPAHQIHVLVMEAEEVLSLQPIHSHQQKLQGDSEGNRQYHRFQVEEAAVVKEQ
jgi:hypothetical protein